MIKKISILLIVSITLLNSCSGAFKPKKVDTRQIPTSGEERARKAVEEGSTGSINDMIRGRRGGTNYEFASSNPMWRASLEILDFIPMTTIDYSGGMIISEWYSGENQKDNESIKITIRFLSNEIRADSLKIIIHKKKCASNSNCSVNLLQNSKISEELRRTIMREAALFEKQSKKNKK